jgi:tRNA (guanine-N7-)-methyltransferase
MEAHETPAPRLVLHGRRRGRALRQGQRHLLETKLPSLAVALPAGAPLDPRTLFSAPLEAVWLELGFGGGEHLAAQAEAQRAVGMIGAEIFENGVAKLLAEIERRALDNIRIFRDDARRLVAALANASIARAFILFPDPWPKERHKKRRLVTHDFLSELARAMADGAELRLATDDRDYAQAMLALGCAHRDFRWPAPGPGDWRVRPADWPATRDEQKAIAAGRPPLYLRFQRRVRETASLGAP